MGSTIKGFGSMDAVESQWGCYLVTLGSLSGRKFKVGSWVWKWKSSGTAAYRTQCPVSMV